MSTPTPRTDATVTGNSSPTQDEYENLADFARTLERELAAEREKVRVLRKFAELVKSGLETGSVRAKSIIDMSDTNATEWPTITLHDQAVAALISTKKTK